MSTFHDSIIKDGNQDIHFPRTDIVSVRSVDGTKTLETLLAEQTAAKDALGAVRTIDYGTCTTYSASATYAIGKLVIYNNRLYKCTTAILVAEAWNAAHWTAIADAQNGTVYNTTDASFYGIRGADSVAKKLGSGDAVILYDQFINDSTRSNRTQTLSYTIPANVKKVLVAKISGYASGFYKSANLNKSTQILDVTQGQVFTISQNCGNEDTIILYLSVTKIE